MNNNDIDISEEVLVLMNNKYSAVINEILNELISETVEKKELEKY